MMFYKQNRRKGLSLSNTAISLLLFSFTLLYSQATLAQMAQNLFIGNAKAFALGNAVTADPPQIDAIHFNPAGLTRLKGRHYQLKGVAVGFNLESTFTASEEWQSQPSLFGLEGELEPNSKADGLTLFLPGGKMVDLPAALAALGGVSYNEEGSIFTFANAVYAPIIAGVHHDDDNDPARFSGQRRAATRLTYLSPAVGIQLTEDVSIGAALAMSYFGVGAEVGLRFPNALLGTANTLTNTFCDFLPEGDNPDHFESLCRGELDPLEPLANIELALEDYFSPTLNLGILWDVSDWITLGATYQTSIVDTLEGDVTISYPTDVVSYLEGIQPFAQLLPIGLLDTVPTTEELKGAVKIEYPQHFSMGASIKVTRKWKVNVDLKWTELSAWKDWEITFDESSEVLELLDIVFGLLGAEGLSNDGRTITIPRGYEDTWSWAFGTEYQYSDRLALRFGYEPRNTGIPDDKLDVILPIGDIDLYGAGFEYLWDKDTTVDFTVGYVRSRVKIPSNSSSNANSTGPTNFIYNPYAGHHIENSLDVLLFEVSYLKKF